MNRIDRLISILTTLQSKKFVTAEFIAAKYEISIRTVYRDIKALGEIGVPITFEPQKGYCILKGFFLPPVSLSVEEAHAIILMASLSSKFADRSIAKNAESAIDKIKSVLQNPDKEKVDFLHSQIRVYQPLDQKNESNYLTIIQNAIVNKNILVIEYRNNSGEFSKREIEPIGMTFYSNQWHIIAWCWKRIEYRDFKITQVISVVQTDEKFRKKTHQDINGYIKSLK